MSIYTIFKKSVERFPDKIVLVEGVGPTRKTITYQELDNDASKIAAFLLEQSVCPGDRVLLFIPLSIQLYTYIVALGKIGATIMFIEPSMRGNNLQSSVHSFPPDVLIGTAKSHFLQVIAPDLSKISKKFTVDYWFPGAQKIHLSEHKNDVLIPDFPLDILALITFTSGTSGVPKAIGRTHQFLIDQQGIVSKHQHHKQKERELCFFPVFLLSNLGDGITSIIPFGDLQYPALIDEDSIIQQIQENQVTSILGPPAFINKILTKTEHKEHLKNVKNVSSGGGPISPDFMKKIQEFFPQADIHPIYGSTEAEPIAVVNYKDISDEDKLKTAQGLGIPCGEVIHEVSLAIIEDHSGEAIGPFDEKSFNQIKLKPYEVGEIVVTGKAVNKSYLNPEKNLENKFQAEGEIWHRTGDSGYLDQSNNLWLMGRCAAKINHHNRWVYPFSIEYAAMADPSIKTAAFIEVKGSQILVLEASQNQVISDEKKTSLRNLFKIDTVIIVPKIPVDDRQNSKIDYPRLKEQLEKNS